MARYDKINPKNGSYRASLAADYDPNLVEACIGVGHDSQGRLVKGAGQTGVVAVLILTKAYKAGYRCDPMVSGEIVEFGPTAGEPGIDFAVPGKVYYSDANGNIEAGTNESQTVTLANATSGTFTLTYAGQTTAAIQYNAAASDVQAALAALSNLGDDDVTVTKTGSVFTINFVAGTVGGTDVVQMTANGGSLVGSSPTVVVATSVAGGSTAGLVRVGFTVDNGQRLIVRVEH